MQNNKKFITILDKPAGFLIISFFAIYLSLHKENYTCNNMP